eukprot:15241226-Alexandrium_andersonii.AAC.1
MRATRWQLRHAPGVSWIELLIAFHHGHGAPDGTVPIAKQLRAFKSAICKDVSTMAVEQQAGRLVKSGPATRLLSVGFCTPVSCCFALPQWDEGMRRKVGAALLGLRSGVTLAQLRDFREGTLSLPARPLSLKQSPRWGHDRTTEA